MEDCASYIGGMLTDDEIDRYARHLVLKEIGGAGQMKLKAAKIALVGMGGIGAPAALYLAAAGVGTLGLIDHDTVSLSNLQRQVLYATADIDRPKVEAAASHLGEINPYTDYIPHDERLTDDNAAGILAAYDLVIDGCDNFPTRLLVNRVCLQRKIPLVSAALGRWSGQLAVFDGSPCYQCLVPEVPPDAETCERVGVIGALAGVMGSLAALEAVKLITGAGTALKGQLMIFDGLTMQSRVVGLSQDPACPVCTH
ncbi:HesA/MoeB/ThiF family protein [Asticcacaulis solisilvae]|uniref:HesA/MoeB/ThiF family protein n=1 Tax=Asticcacaulis solisilvae TaxID=1217274 RepID=UPI003FD84760